MKGHYGSIAEVPHVLRACDSVELKLAVPAGEAHRMAAVLGVDLRELHGHDTPAREVYYLDTPGLALEAGGVIVRVRRSPGGGADAVVRIRPADPCAVDPNLRRHKGFRVELDMVGDGFVCSATLKTRLPSATVTAAAAPRSRLSTLFTGRQQRLFGAYAPPGLALDELSVFGAVRVRRLARTVPGWEQPLSVQLWSFPQEPLVELSTRVPAERAAHAIAAWPAFLARHGLTRHPQPHTKAQVALRSLPPKATFV